MIDWSMKPCSSARERGVRCCPEATHFSSSVMMSSRSERHSQGERVVLPAPGDPRLGVAGHPAEEREEPLRILLHLARHPRQRTDELHQLASALRVLQHVGGGIDAEELAVRLVVLEDHGVGSECVCRVLRLGLPHRDRVGLAAHHRGGHASGGRRHDGHVRLGQSGRPQHRHQVVVRRRVTRHHNALALEVGQCSDARGALRDDAVQPLGQREEQPYLRVVSQHDQHLRGGVGGGVGAVVGQRADAAVDVLHAWSERAVVERVDRPGLQRRRGARHREQRVGCQRRRRRSRTALLRALPRQRNGQRGEEDGHDSSSREITGSHHPSRSLQP